MKKQCWPKMWLLNLWNWTHLYPKKAQIEQKFIMVFNENLQEIVPWFWLIFDGSFWFSLSSRGKFGAKLDQKLKLWVLWKILYTNVSFLKSFKSHLYNYEDYLWSKLQLSLTFFTGLLPPNLPKWANWILKQNKCCCSF